MPADCAFPHGNIHVRRIFKNSKSSEMIRIPGWFILAMLLTPVLNAQDGKLVIVKAGTRVTDYYSRSERYLYPAFVEGQIALRNGRINKAEINYDILFGEVVFLQGSDTLSISRKKDVRYIVAGDTFLFDNGYVRILSGGEVRVGVKNYVKLNNILKRGAYGTTARSGTVETYETMSAQGNSFDLVPDQDLELKTMVEYWLSADYGGFTLFTKRNVMQLFPDNEDEIKAYIKTNKTDFNSMDDLLLLSGYLRTLR